MTSADELMTPPQLSPHASTRPHPLTPVRPPPPQVEEKLLAAAPLYVMMAEAQASVTYRYTPLQAM